MKCNVDEFLHSIVILESPQKTAPGQAENCRYPIRVQAQFAQSTILCFEYFGFHDHVFNCARLFDTCCKFGTSYEYLYSYFGIFRVNQNNFHWYKIDLIQVLLPFQ